MMKLAARLIVLLMALLAAPNWSHAGREHPERWYQQIWCKEHGGQEEKGLPGGTRCDCLTDSHVIEFDFGDKWYEAVGQSLYYSLKTEKRAGIVLILETEKDKKFWERLNSTIERFNLPIDVWSIRGILSGPIGRDMANR